MADPKANTPSERRVGVLAKHAEASVAAQAAPGGTPRIAWRFAGMENPNLREERAKSATPRSCAPMARAGIAVAAAARPPGRELVRCSAPL